MLAGHVIDLRDEIYFEGDSIKDLKASMKRAVDHYLEVCEKRGEEPGRPFTGQLRIRMDSKLASEDECCAPARPFRGSTERATRADAIPC
jgi:predicted HicB family RNase H-like nuclease